MKFTQQCGLYYHGNDDTYTCSVLLVSSALRELKKSQLKASTLLRKVVVLNFTPTKCTKENNKCSKQYIIIIMQITLGKWVGGKDLNFSDTKRTRQPLHNDHCWSQLATTYIIPAGQPHPSNAQENRA